MSRLRLPAGVLACAALIAPGLCAAATIRVDLQGATLGGPYLPSQPDPDFAPGIAFTGFFEYDDQTAAGPIPDSAAPLQAQYDLAYAAITNWGVSFADGRRFDQASGAMNSGMLLGNDRETYGDSMNATLAFGESTGTPLASGRSFYAFAFRWSDLPAAGQDLLAGSSLGGAVPLFANAGMPQGSIIFGNRSFLDLRVDSVSVAPVPLPAAAWLLLSGLAAVGTLARRRRARSGA